MSEARAGRWANQRLDNQRKQIPSAPKLRTSNLDFNFKPSIGRFQFFSPPPHPPRLVSLYPLFTSRRAPAAISNNAGSIASSRRAHAGYCTPEPPSEFGTQPPSPSLPLDPLSCCNGFQPCIRLLLESFTNCASSEHPPHPPVPRTRALRSI